jgi:hypothetical protein
MNPRVIYTAYFVVNPKKLLEEFPPKHKNIFAHHSTIEFRPKNGLEGINIGEKKYIEVLGRVFDEKGDAVLVDNDKSIKENSHITISCAENIPPVYSDEMIQKAIKDGSVEIFSEPIFVEVIEGYFDGIDDVIK